MISLFRKKIALSDFVASNMSNIFSDDSTSYFLAVRSMLLEDFETQTFLNEMRAAHIQLLTIFITKKHGDIEMSIATSLEIKAYLLKRFNDTNLYEISSQYNTAFGSSSTDGIAEMAKLSFQRCAGKELSILNLGVLRELFYDFLSNLFLEGKNKKIIIN